MKKEKKKKERRHVRDTGHQNGQCNQMRNHVQGPESSKTREARERTAQLFSTIFKKKKKFFRRIVPDGNGGKFF